MWIVLNHSRISHSLKEIHFTPREWEVLSCIAKGFITSKDIGKRLQTSPKTIETHISHILTKTGCHSRYHLADFIRSGDPDRQLEQFYSAHLDHPENERILRRVVSLFLPHGKKFLVIGITAALFALGIERAVHYSAFFVPTRGDTSSSDRLIQRQHLVEMIHQTLLPGTTVALVGPGGAGKTTLAKLYAEKYPTQCVGFIEAANASSMMSSFKALAEHLVNNENQHLKLQRILSLPEHEQTKQLVSFVYESLKDQSSWLLVFDNVDDLALCRGFLPPHSYQGGILMTTRDQNIQNNPIVSSVIQVEDLSLEESWDLLRRLLPPIYDDASIKNFVSQIPSFPLDISLAAHYIRDAHLSFDDYLQQLKSHQPTFHEHEQKLWHEVSGYPQTRYAIIDLSTETLLTQKPVYLEFLWILATLSPQNIPLHIFHHTAHPNMIDAFMHDLRQFSFLTNETHPFGHPIMSLHQSTQEILRHCLITRYGEPPYSAIATTLMHCTEHAMEEGDVLTLHKLIPHFEALESHIKDPMFHPTLGMLYYHAGQYTQARDVLEKELPRLQKAGTKLDEELLKVMIYLGNTYKELVISDKAEDMLQKALTLCQQHFRSEPAKTVKLLVSLAHIYRRLGDFKKAEDLCDQSLKLCEQNASTDYDSLSAIHMALCVIHREQGHYKKAEEHIHTSLHLLEHHLPTQKLDYAHALRLWGHVYSDQGHYEQARDLYEKSLDLFMKHDLPQHPKALWLYAKLGTIYRRLGDVDKANFYLDQAEHNAVFSSSPVVMGLTHHERAHLYIQTQKYDKALIEAQKSLQVYTQLYGEQHVKSRRALNLVGYVLMHQGKLDEAEHDLKQAFQTFGEKGLPLKCQALDYLSELYRRRACSAVPEQFEALQQKSLDYIHQAINVAEQYFPHDSSHLKHLTKQKERITGTRQGDKIGSYVQRTQ